jgi:acyl carrier protein
MTNSRFRIKEKIESYIHQTAHVDKDKIKDDTLIFREGYFDSMGFIMLITFIEGEFGIKTCDADLIEENFESINAITDFIDRKTKPLLCVE